MRWATTGPSPGGARPHASRALCADHEELTRSFAAAFSPTHAGRAKPGLSGLDRVGTNALPATGTASKVSASMTYETSFDDVDVDFPKRVQNAVYKKFVVEGGRRLDQVTVGDVCALTFAEWMRIPNVGRISVGELMVLLAEHGLELAIPEKKRTDASPEAPLPPLAVVPIVNPIFPMKLRKAIEEVERSWVLAALKETRGNMTLAARLLGITKQGVAYKMDRFGLPRPARPRLPTGSAPVQTP
jgi:hypothetical protein